MTVSCSVYNIPNGSPLSLSWGTMCRCATQWQAHKQREAHGNLWGCPCPYWRLILWAPKRRLLTVYYLCFWSLSLRDFRNSLWALRTQTGLLHCLCCQIRLWWRFFFKGHQTFMGSTLPKDSRLFFSSVIYLFFQPGAAHNLYCALLSLLAAVSCLQKQWESGTWA